MLSLTSVLFTGACILATPLVHAAPSPIATKTPNSIVAESNIVGLRIEGANSTIYEAPIYSGPRNITTAGGGTHLCDGTNLNTNPTPGNTPIDALDAASKLAKFPYDGTFHPNFDDYFITSIGSSTQTSTEFWGLLVNFQFTPVGGCRYEVKPWDQVLWAYNAFSLKYFLKVTPNKIVARKGSSHVVTVTDGMTDVPVGGAMIDGVTTAADGTATLTFGETGVFEYKATRSDSLRSNALYVAVA